MTVQVRLAVPYIESPDSKESGLFYVQKIKLKGFYMAATAYALHILVKHKEIAEDIIEQLGKGAKFQTLAKKYSSCPSGKKGGDLGEFKRGQMVPQFDKIAFKGAILEPHLVKTKFGWHVIKVLYRT